MAGPYVHCLVTRETLKRLNSDPSLAPYQDITAFAENADYYSFVCLGSVSPDLPYPALALGFNRGKDSNGWTWGDKFHKQNTGDFIKIGLQKLRSEPNKSSDQFLKRAAWLMGYYAHVTTDLIIHAVVYELVGGCYEKYKKDHLYCEVVQDSLLFYDLYTYPPRELIDVKMIKNVIEKCRVEVEDEGSITDLPSYELDEDIESFWRDILSLNYSDFYNIENPRIQDWFYEYDFIMIDGTKAVARDFASQMAYQWTADIPRDHKEKYYTHMVLPNGRTDGDYKIDVFNKSVNEVVRKVTIFLKAINNDASFTELINDLKPWNIDKGTLDDQSKQFALWSGRTEDPFDCPGDPPRT